jgi:hypothetical protein
MHELGQGLMVDARGLHHDPAVGRNMRLQPGLERLEASGSVGQLGLGAVLAVGLQHGHIEAVFGGIYAYALHLVLLLCSTSIPAPGPALSMRALAGGGPWIPFGRIE